MQSRLFKELLHRPVGLGALIVLGLLYLTAIFAGFLSPYAMSEQSLTQTYHPPTKIFWKDGGLRVQAYELVDPGTAEYQPVAGKSYPLRFFVKGFEYRLLGLLPLQTHLFGVEAEQPPPPTGAEPTSTADVQYDIAAPANAEPAHAADLQDDTVSPADAEPTATAVTQRNAPSPVGALVAQDAAAATDESALEAVLAPPQPRIYLLGSDSTGRDVFSRLLYGSRISLTIGIIGISITMALGFLIGGFSGYFGGRFDFFAMRGVEFLMAIPSLYLLLALRSALADRFSALGSDGMFLMIIVILALVGWAGTARILRGLSLSLSRQQFVLAAESMGQRPLTILLRHILPNLSSYLLVAATLAIPGYILGEAALSFLGLGIQEPATSWGLMLSQAQDIKVFYLNFWWLLSPGVAILVTVMAFNILGDALREIISPKS